MLNGSGRFADILPRYCEDVGIRIDERFLYDAEDSGVGVSIFIVLNNAAVFPWFKILPDRVGLSPVYLTLRLFTPNCISPTTTAPRLKEVVLTR
jgi:hypothetical protein